MKRWGLFLFTIFLLIACESKKEKNAFLFILSFDSLDYVSASPSEVGTGLNLDTGSVISSATTSASAATSDEKNRDGSGFGQTSTSSISSADSLDTESFIDLNDNTRQAFVSVASQNVNSCSGSGVLASISCSLDGFLVNIGSLLSAASDIVSLQISGINRDGDGVTSNALSGRRYVLRKIFSTASTITDARDFVEHNEKLYFSATVGGTNSFLMSYDGTTLSKVLELSGGTESVDSVPLKSFGEQLIFRGNVSGSGYQLFSLEGEVIKEILDLNSGNGDTVGNIVEFGDSLYISLAPAAGAMNIYRYTGTSTFKMISDTGGHSSYIRAAADDGVYYFFDHATDDTNNGLYRLNPSAAISNRKITDQTYTHTNSEYFVLNGKLYFTAVFGGNNQIFMVDGDTIKLVSTLAMTGISVYNNVAYGMRDESGSVNLYRFTGTVLERLNPDTIVVSENPVASPSILATASGVYFVRDPSPSSGTANDVFRYQLRRFERLFSMEEIAAGTSTERFFEFNNEIYFTAYTGSATGLYKIELQ